MRYQPGFISDATPGRLRTSVVEEFRRVSDTFEGLVYRDFIPSSVTVTTGGTPTGDITDAQTMMDGNGGFSPSLLGYPVVYSAKSGATAASAKSLYFGNWNFVGLYEAPGFSLIRDPYTRSSFGEVILNYMFRCDYGVLQAEAIGYGVHPSA